MDVHKELTLKLTWPYDGTFSATLVNNIITDLNFCEIGGADCRKCLASTDIKFLKNVHSALTDLFKKMDEEGKSNGHSYAKEPEA
jgi:hypothetical protein